MNPLAIVTICQFQAGQAPEIARLAAWLISVSTEIWAKSRDGSPNWRLGKLLCMCDGNRFSYTALVRKITRSIQLLGVGHAPTRPENSKLHALRLNVRAFFKNIASYRGNCYISCTHNICSFIISYNVKCIYCFT